MESRLARLLYHQLREQGIHLQEGFPCFLTTAHTEADLAEVRWSLSQCALKAMCSGEALPSPVQVSSFATAAYTRLGDTPIAVAEAPIADSQREILLASQVDAEASCAFNESVTLRLEGPLDRDALLRSLDTLMTRHEALRLTITPDGEHIRVVPNAKLALREEDWSAFAADERARRQSALLRDEASTPFDPFRGLWFAPSCLGLRRKDMH